MNAARFRLIYGLAAVLLLSAGLVPNYVAPSATAQVPLFTESSRQPSLAAGAVGRGVVRNRYVDVNFTQLDAAVRAPVSQSAALQMNLFPFESDLFPDVSISAIRQRVGATRSGQGAIWFGKAQGAPDSAVTLVSEGGVLVGNIQVGNRFYQIRYAGGGVHAIQEINSSLYPDESPPLRIAAPGAAAAVASPPTRTATPVPPSTKPGAPPASAAANQAAPTNASSNPLADNGSTIDVLVVYSQGAATAANGAIDNLITLMESETNQGYLQSNVVQRVRVVGRQQVASAEGSSLNTYLTALMNGTGAFTSIPGLRNTVGADMVYLIQNVVSDPCGLAAMVLPSIAAGASTTYAPNGYAAGELDCSTGSGGWTFGHELGHLMGARHDWNADNTNNSPFTYNHGYVQPGPGRSCDVMATRANCNAAGNARANYWSNPNIIVSGLPIGIPESQANAAENWKTLNNTASTVANFRTCTVNPCDVPPTVGPTAVVPDNFVNATVVGALPASFTLNTSNATTETGEQFPPCQTNFGKSVWFAFTPAAATQVTVSTAGSGFDTVIGVWTGGALGALTSVACSDDFGGTLQSQVTFTAAAGTTYRIQIGGYGAAGGSLSVAFTGSAVPNTPTPTSIPTPVVNCNPRPRVTVNAQSQGAGSNNLVVTILPGANGWINQIGIGAATNARIDIAGQTGVTGNQTFALPPATTTFTFVVHHDPPGQATTVPMTVVDTCGSWQTFVGGGASAF